MLRVRAIDDRGRVSRLAVLAPAKPGARWPWLSIVWGTLQALVEVLRSRAGLSVLIMVALTLCMLGLLGFGGPFAAFLILFTPVASILILVAVNSLTSMAVLAGEARASLRSRWVQVERCPSCSYDLSGVLIEPDRCRLCPECGSAWRADDSTETVVLVRTADGPGFQSRDSGWNGVAPQLELASSRAIIPPHGDPVETFRGGSSIG